MRSPLDFLHASLDSARVSFKRSLDGVYTQCVLGYSDADSSATTDQTFQPEVPPTNGKVLNIN